MTYENKVVTADGWQQDEIVTIDGKVVGYVRIQQRGDAKTMSTHCNGEKRDGMKLSWLVQKATETSKNKV